MEVDKQRKKNDVKEDFFVKWRDLKMEFKELQG